jgi:AraC-like DNA-binding protein
MGLTAVARIPLALLGHAVGLGLDRSELLRKVGLRDEVLEDPDRRVPASKLEHLWRVVITQASCPALGIRIGASLTVRQWGLVGYTMVYSRTLVQALQRVARYGDIMSEAVQCSLQIERDHTKLVADGGPRLDALRHPVDARFASMVGVAREITGVGIVPIEVRFRYERPAEISEHARFFRCPIAFGQPIAALLFRNEDLQLPVVSADETLCGYLDRLADEVVQSLGSEHSFTEKLQRAIWAELSGGRPTLQRTALALGVSVRTLQRRLREEGTTYGAVLEAFRREMAVRLLRDRRIAVCEVAYLLGYSEPSTLRRAFRTWHGVTPAEFRRSLS